MVTLKNSYAPGDVIECENDQAWNMINDQLGKLSGKKQPEKPQAIIEAEEKAKQAILDAKKQTEADSTNQLADREMQLEEIEAAMAIREEELVMREQEVEEKALSLEIDAQAK